MIDVSASYLSAVSTFYLIFLLHNNNNNNNIIRNDCKLVTEQQHQNKLYGLITIIENKIRLFFSTLLAMLTDHFLKAFHT